MSGQLNKSKSGLEKQVPESKRSGGPRGPRGPLCCIRAAMSSLEQAGAQKQPALIISGFVISVNDAIASQKQQILKRSARINGKYK